MAIDSTNNQAKINEAVVELQEKTSQLIEIIDGVNLKVTNLAAATEEMAAATTEISDVSGRLKGKLEELAQ